MSKKTSSYKLLDQFSKRQSLYLDTLEFQPTVVKNISIQRLVVRRCRAAPPLLTSRFLQKTQRDFIEAMFF